MRQPWLYFCYWIHASVVNSVTLSIPYGSCHSVFNDDFLVYSDSVFANDFWIRSDIAFLTIPCVNYYSGFAIDLMHQSWIHWRCGFHTSAVTQFSITITRCTVILFSVTIYGSVVTQRFRQFHASPMTIFAIDLMRRSWIHWRCGFHTSAVNQYSLTISRSIGLSFRWWFMDK
jgi:hypothetical protein